MAGYYKLGATRIGHGVKAIEDTTLLDYLLKHKIGIESCLTSNSQTSTVTSFTDHGVVACLNSDDPAVEGIELAYEYQVVATKVVLNQDQTRQAQINGLEVAFLFEAEKSALRNEALNR